MVDGAIGRVLDALESSPHSRNTLLLFSSDHGDAHIHHRHTQKTLLYDSVCKVPMMASWPEALPEGVADAAHLVSGLDVTPTICDFAGIAPPPAMRGLSLRPALEERPVEWRDFLVSSSLGRGRMIRTADWKLIRFEGENEMQLFDSPNDPYEMHELSRGSNRFDTAIAELAKALGEYEASLDPAPLPPAPAAGARGARRQANAEE